MGSAWGSPGARMWLELSRWLRPRLVARWLRWREQIPPIDAGVDTCTDPDCRPCRLAADRLR